MSPPYIPIIHMFIVAPLLLYIGYNIYKNKPMNTEFGMFILLLALLIFLYHSYKLYIYTKK